MSTQPADRHTALAMLEEAHSFPCAFAFKAIGRNDPSFPAQLAQAAVLVVGLRVQPKLALRESAHGRHVAVTVTLMVQSAAQVLDVYQALRQVDGLHMLL